MSFDYKQMTERQLKRVFADYDFIRDPYWHQLVTWAWSLDRNRVSWWADIGTGKTFMALNMMYLWEVKKALVVCPNSVIRTWKKETKKYSRYNFYPLTGSIESRVDTIVDGDDGIYAINYEGFIRVFGIHKKKEGIIIDQQMVDDVIGLGFEGLICDECHKMRNSRTTQSRIMALLSRKVDKVIFMTGTPIGKSLLDLWGEFYALDGGLTLGRSFFKFRKKYFKENRLYDFVIRGKEEKKSILKSISNTTIRFDRSECRDIKKPVRTKREVIFSKQQKKMYKSLIDNWSVKLGKEKISFDSALVLYLKLKQICSGFLIDKEKKVFHFYSDKYRVLLDCIEEIKGQVLVFHNFVEEGRMIEEALWGRKIKYSSLRGEIKKKDENIERFIEGGSKVMVLHPASGGEGLDGLQCADSAIFFSNSDTGNIVRSQCEGRIDRSGQINTCTFIDVYIKNSIEELILKKKLDNQKIMREIMKWMRNAKAI